MAFNGQWQLYDPLKPGLSNLYEMAPGKGYWINMNSSAYLNVTGNSPSNTINLSKGWNLAGIIQPHPGPPGWPFQQLQANITLYGHLRVVNGNFITRQIQAQAPL
jgi:hypothetical protein